MHSVYAITNSRNGKMYIGSARNTRKRWRAHRSLLSRGKHHSPALQHSYDVHGADAFEWSIVEYVDDENKLLVREQLWMDFFKPAFNTAKVAGSPTAGMKASPEAIAKRAAALRGKKRAPFSTEHCARISASKIGQTFSAETLERMREEKRRRFTPEYTAKWRADRIGKTLSLETRAKISASLLARRRSPRLS